MAMPSQLAGSKSCTCKQTTRRKSKVSMADSAELLLGTVSPKNSVRSVFLQGPYATSKLTMGQRALDYIHICIYYYHYHYNALVPLGNMQLL